MLLLGTVVHVYTMMQMPKPKLHVNVYLGEVCRAGGLSPACGVVLSRALGTLAPALCLLPTF